MMITKSNFFYFSLIASFSVLFHSFMAQADPIPKKGIRYKVNCSFSAYEYYTHMGYPKVVPMGHKNLPGRVKWTYYFNADHSKYYSTVKNSTRDTFFGKNKSAFEVITYPSNHPRKDHVVADLWNEQVQLLVKKLNLKWVDWKKLKETIRFEVRILAPKNRKTGHYKAALYKDRHSKEFIPALWNARHLYKEKGYRLNYTLRSYCRGPYKVKVKMK